MHCIKRSTHNVQVCNFSAFCFGHLYAEYWKIVSDARMCAAEVRSFEELVVEDRNFWDDCPDGQSDAN